jgi:hypothetical protein
MRYSFLLLFLLLNVSCQNKVNNNKNITIEKPISQVKEDILLSKVKDIPLPDGYKRMSYTEGSFAAYLQNLTLKKDKTVYLYNGEKKENQAAQYAVLDISVSNRDLQQCADALMRIRAEYYFSNKMYKNIAFNAVSGKRMAYMDWANGSRNLLTINTLSQSLKANADLSRPTFLKYMDFVFAYASTISLAKEMQPLSNQAEMSVGDAFIKAGSPGHAVIVVDMAIHEKTKKRIFLLAQSYMPAQDIHILKNPNTVNTSPWYTLPIENQLITPEWVFKINELKRFKNSMDNF